MLAFNWMKESKQPACDGTANQLCIVLCIAQRSLLLNTRHLNSTVIVVILPCIKDTPFPLTFNVPSVVFLHVITFCQMNVYSVRTFGLCVSFLSEETIDQRRFPNAKVPNKHTSNEIVRVSPLCQWCTKKRQRFWSEMSYFLRNCFLKIWNNKSCLYRYDWIICVLI